MRHGTVGPDLNANQYCDVRSIAAALKISLRVVESVFAVFEYTRLDPEA